MHLQGIDYFIIFLYSGFVLGVGFALKRFMRTSLDFFLSGRRICSGFAEGFKTSDWRFRGSTSSCGQRTL